MAYLQKGATVPLTGKGSKLGPKMRIFVSEYIVDFNGTKAVLRAGYKTTIPEKLSRELLSHPLVERAINEHLDKRTKKMEVTANYVIQKLIKIVEDTDVDNPQAALRGLELLGKHLGLYRDKTEISGPDGKAIEMEQRTKEDVADFTSSLSRLIKQRGEGTVVSLTSRKRTGGA